MVFYGTGSKDLGSKKIPNEKCPLCEAQNTIEVHGVSKYFDVFWVPVFPYSKKLIPFCTSCETEITKKQIPASLKEKIALEKSFFKTPITLFSGLIIIAGIVGWISYTSSKHKDYANDVMVLKQSSKEYSFALVDGVENDTVYFKNSNYSFNQKPTKSDYTEGLAEKTDFFDMETYYYTQSQIDSVHKIKELDIFEK